MSGLMRGHWKPLSAGVRGRRVRQSVRERLQVSASALLYPDPTMTPDPTNYLKF